MVELTMNNYTSPPSQTGRISQPNSLPFILCCLLLLSPVSTDPAPVDPNHGALRFEPQEGQYRDARSAGESRLVTGALLHAGPFQLCLACKCCAAGTPAPTCASMPCCFAIDCQIPGKPFGVCAFVPKTCDCTSCADA